MRYGVLGTGVVGRTLGSKLAGLGHEVTLGSRNRGGAAATAWVAQTGDGAAEGTFEDAARAGEVVVNATSGEASLRALELAGAAHLAGKVVVDVANPLHSSGGFPFTLAVCNEDSLAEQIQRAYPDARVVKTLNTVTAAVMVDPASLGRGHAVFVSGDEVAAKAQVTDMLVSFGWPREDVVDLGGLASARGPEMYLPLWMRLMSALGSPQFNIALRRG